ncbi:hypothetical protein [Phaeobacter inhibens]|uniref:hypothetical protein n=1 Tax=Phaeobacter inhibens TaxID=221822 RepID=UPI0021A2A250|nr:hypothetical protein [Phaeobacter inhibens]UWR96396.1 hypothetical protein K4K99_00925 [Phaeobacter inhibens]
MNARIESKAPNAAARPAVPVVRCDCEVLQPVSSHNADKPDFGFSAFANAVWSRICCGLSVAMQRVSPKQSFTVADQSRTQTALLLLAAWTFKTQTKRTCSNVDIAHAAFIRSRSTGHAILSFGALSDTLQIFRADYLFDVEER